MTERLRNIDNDECDGEYEQREYQRELLNAEFAGMSLVDLEYEIAQHEQAALRRRRYRVI